jgi:hypothetical protein
VCDVKNDFWHVQLEEELSYLTTFSTQCDRHRWSKMLMGFSPTPDIFQRKLSQVLKSLHGIHIIAYDIFITGEGDMLEIVSRNHSEKPRSFLNRCKLNADKFCLRRK